MSYQIEQIAHIIQIFFKGDKKEDVEIFYVQLMIRRALTCVPGLDPRVAPSAQPATRWMLNMAAWKVRSWLPHGF